MRVTSFIQVRISLLSHETFQYNFDIRAMPQWYRSVGRPTL